MIKPALILLLLFFLIDESISCELFNPSRHINPDGSMGGLVSSTAHVDSTVFISSNARVCGKAWIEGNAKVLDYSRIYDQAWVRANSIVSGQASVFGNSVLKGVAGYETHVRGTSRISGSANLLDGTIIEGKAWVYGGAILRKSFVTGSARICGSFKISDRRIDDRYFCNSGERISKIKISSKTSENVLSSVDSDLLFIAEDVGFGSEKNQVFISLNDNVLPESSFDVRNNRLTILSRHLEFQEGSNEIKIWGKDEFGFRIEENVFFLNVGKSRFDLPEIDYADAFNISFMEAELSNGNVRFKTKIVKDGPQLFLPSVFTNLEGWTLQIRIVADKFAISSSFAMTDPPEKLHIFKMPAYRSNDGSISPDLSNWKSNKPENLQVYLNGNKYYLSITPDENEDVYITRTFMLDDDYPGYEVINAISNPQIEVFDYSYEEKKFTTFKIYSSAIPSFSKSANLKKSLHTFVLKVPASSGVYPVRSFSFPGLNPKEIAVSFSPFDLWFYSYTLKELNAKIEKEDDKYEESDLSAPIGGTENLPSNCNFNQAKFVIPNDFSVASDFNPITSFFSAGSFPFGLEDYLKESRIYADITVQGKKARKDSTSFNIIIKQNGLDVISHPLERCAYDFITYNSSNNTLQISKEKNIAKFIFAIPQYKLSQLSLCPDCDVVLQLEARVVTEEEVFISRSPASESLKIMHTPTLLGPGESGSFRYTGSIDHYDARQRAGLVRTGGDKWFRPGLTNAFSQILLGSHWKFNDLSKINGGVFKGHSGHKEGFDADIRFPDFKVNGINITHDFDLNDTVFKWKESLKNIEFFLSGLSYLRNSLYTIFITNTSNNYVRKWFDMRCLENRFIDLYRSSDRDRDLIHTRSLLNNEKQHQHHLHLAFNRPTDDGNADFKNPVLPTFKISDLKFTITNDGSSIKIEPRNKNAFKDYNILWRLQDRSGHQDFDAEVSYGSWYFEDLDKPIEVKPISSPFEKYLSVVIGHRDTGACIDEDLIISSNKIYEIK